MLISSPPTSIQSHGFFLLPDQFAKTSFGAAAETATVPFSTAWMTSGAPSFLTLRASLIRSRLTPDSAATFSIVDGTIVPSSTVTALC